MKKHIVFLSLKNVEAGKIHLSNPQSSNYVLRGIEIVHTCDNDKPFPVTVQTAWNYESGTSEGVLNGPPYASHRHLTSKEGL